jgi:uncharacterized ferritin-like protein (DUF455 family)
MSASSQAQPPTTAPAEGTVERWAWEYIEARSLPDKLAPPPPPSFWERSGTARRLTRPGRPAELRIESRAHKARGLQAPSGRARALHTFLHHELQAAELMAWAILAFPETPIAFRRGLLRIALDEIRHMALYAERIAALGHGVGEFPVRDWFWERVPTVTAPSAFVAVMGLGLESANLEHTATFAARFRAAGDEESAAIQETVGREEIAHVAFGVRWFSEWSGGLEFDAWCRALPPPLTPLLMRGTPLAEDARRKAGQPDAFRAELKRWQPDLPSS